MIHEATIRGVGVSVGAEGIGAPAVVLDVRDAVVPIFVDGGQARSIERARRGVPAERPMTHDLFAAVLEDAGVTLDRVRIDDIEDGTFYAKLDLLIDRSDGSSKVVRDARPSDAIALAVRLESPVLVADGVIDSAGQPPGILDPDGSDRQPDDGRESDPGGGASAAGDTDEAVEIDLDDPAERDRDERDRDDDPAERGRDDGAGS